MGSKLFEMFFKPNFYIGSIDQWPMEVVFNIFQTWSQNA